MKCLSMKLETTVLRIVLNHLGRSNQYTVPESFKTVAEEENISMSLTRNTKEEEEITTTMLSIINY